MPYKNIKLLFTLKNWSKYLSVTVIAFSCFVIIGWLFNVGFLKHPFPGFVGMNPVTAILFILSGITLYLLTLEKIGQHSIFTVVLPIIIMGSGLFIFSGTVFNFDPRIDNLLFTASLREDLVNNFPNRMAPNTAFCFFLTGFSLLLIKNQNDRKKNLAQLLAFAIFFIGLLSILGYLYKVDRFYGFLNYIPMAIHSAICFLLLSVALLFSFPGKGIMKNFTSEYSGSTSARFLIPVAVIIPILLGYLRLLGEWAVYYSSEFGAAILVISLIIILFILIWYNAYSLNKKDTLRQQAEIKTKEANNFLNTVLDNIPNMIFVKDEKELRFVKFNKAGEKLLGVSADDLIGKNDYDFFPKDQADFFTNKDKEVIHNGDLLDIPEEPIQTKKGERWLHTKKIPVILNESKFLVGISEDITEKREYESQLIKLNAELEAKIEERTKEIAELNRDLEKKVLDRTEQLTSVNKELESFSYSVSHDLRAPLRAINGYAKMIEEDYGKLMDDEGKRLLSNVQYNAQRMGNLIDDLLAFSRLGRKELLKTDVNIKELVEGTIADLAKTIQHRAKIEIRELHNAKADYSLISQVFYNILANAVKYSSKRESPLIIIDSKKNENEVIYCIKDNGAGFDMKYINKLFGIFQRLHADSEFEGTGVGLAIVQRIISKHGGKVWAEAEVDKGASFYFSLPL
jgi:PAS domain S-box-containing protein